LRHEHRFDELGAAATRMTDRMTIRAPFAPLLAMYLRRLLRQRAAHIKLLAERH